MSSCVIWTKMWLSNWMTALVSEIMHMLWVICAPTNPLHVCLSQIKRMLDKKIYIIQGEIGTVVGAIKRNSRWNTHTPLVSSRPAIFTHYLSLLPLQNPRENDIFPLTVFAESCNYGFVTKRKTSSVFFPQLWLSDVNRKICCFFIRPFRKKFYADRGEGFMLIWTWSMSTLDEGPYCHRLDKVSLRKGKWHMWGTKGGQAEGVQEEWESLGFS